VFSYFYFLFYFILFYFIFALFLNYGFQRKIEEVKLGLQDVLEGLKLSFLGQFVSYLILVPAVFCIPSTDAKEKKINSFFNAQI